MSTSTSLSLSLVSPNLLLLLFPLSPIIVHCFFLDIIKRVFKIHYNFRVKLILSQKTLSSIYHIYIQIQRKICAFPCSVLCKLIAIVVFTKLKKKQREKFRYPMSFIEDLMFSFFMDHIRQKTGSFSDTIMLQLSQSISNTACGSAVEETEGCRDSSASLTLKIVAICAILIAGVCGVGIPLVGKKHRFLRTDSNLFFTAKAFAAGVILATGFVHMLPGATSSLTNPCLPKSPWSKFPFAGFIAMMAALATLVVDFVGTQYYEKKQEKQNQKDQADSGDLVSESAIVPVEPKPRNEKLFGEEEGGAIHIVGMHAHAAHHRHSHSHEQGDMREHSHGHSHSHSFGGGDGEGGVRHVVVSQVLELGIVSHSVIIGVSLGVSESPCTIRPLLVALSFHQFFEGFALGGCISQAQFNSMRSTVMATFFAVTTPLGIAIGIGAASSYDPHSPRALVVEGILDSISAGILVYMALVDLIAADFLSKRMSCNTRLQVFSYFALFLGAGLMSLLAIWA